MTQRISPDTGGADAPTALTAFLRGMERRGLAFAWLLSGSRETGETALAWAVARFRREAGTTRFGDWPRRFWSTLLGAPALRRPPADPRWGPAFAPLARLGHGPRAALLLRLAAGLAESDAAAVLGTTRPTYRLGLARALPRRADGSADVEAWRALGEATQDLQRSLPPGLLSAAMGGDTGHGITRGRARATTARARVRRPASPGVRAALWLVAVLTLLALLASFVAPERVRFDRLPEGLDEAPGGVIAEPLPPPEPPAGRYPAEAALELHPDLALLLDADDVEPAATHPAFHSWLVAEARADEVDPPAAGASATVASTPGTAAGDPQARLAALGPAARARLEQRRERWDALPPDERGERRERWQAWQALPRAEQRELRAAAARHASLTPAEQAALRARFEALDASLRRGWLLGPDLGADYERLHPLVAQVPPEARTVLVEVLRALDAQGRDDLAVLAVRTPPEARAELRIELLATPPEQRGRWLRRRVSPPQ